MRHDHRRDILIEPVGEIRHVDSIIVTYLAQHRLLDKNCQAYALGRERTVDAIEMACIALGTDREGLARRPAVLAIINTNSPMQLDTPMTEAVLELAGVKDVLSKSFGSTNPMNLVKATMDGLAQLRTKEQIAEVRGVEL